MAFDKDLSSLSEEEGTHCIRKKLHELGVLDGELSEEQQDALTTGVYLTTRIHQLRLRRPPRETPDPVSPRTRSIMKDVARRLADLQAATAALAKDLDALEEVDVEAWLWLVDDVQSLLHSGEMAESVSDRISVLEQPEKQSREAAPSRERVGLSKVVWTRLLACGLSGHETAERMALIEELIWGCKDVQPETIRKRITRDNRRVN